MLSHLDRNLGAARRTEDSSHGYGTSPTRISVIDDDVLADLGKGAVELCLWHGLGRQETGTRDTMRKSRSSLSSHMDSLILPPVENVKGRRPKVTFQEWSASAFPREGSLEHKPVDIVDGNKSVTITTTIRKLLDSFWHCVSEYLTSTANKNCKGRQNQGANQDA